jgi:uncharacterized membrane protein YuzA (DUF378 family)
LWQRLASIGVCISAARFIGGSVWQLLGLLAPVLGLFFGGWLLACILEPLVGIAGVYCWWSPCSVLRSPSSPRG